MSDNPRIQVGSTLDLLIEKLVYGGDGFAHVGSRACFVKNVIPGEKVSVKVDTIKSQYLIASSREILNPSPYRIHPPCPIVNDCGGCQWQHLSYEHQLHWKGLILQECLARIAGLRDQVILAPLPSPHIFNYRYRATFKVGLRGVPALGYFKEKTHDIVPVTSCALLAAPLNNALAACWKMLESKPAFFNDIAEIEMLFIHKDNRTMLGFKNNKTKSTVKRILSGSAQTFTTHDEVALDVIHDITFRRDMESFYQVNYQQNLNMIDVVLEYFSPGKNDKILDLYCGCGNFSLFLGRKGAEVTGIESNGFAVQEAQYNAAHNSIHTCQFVKADVNNLGPDVINTTFNGVLLNPPRSGCPKGILNSIAEAKPHTIVYVSCNPATLARDLQELVSSGYAIEEIRPVDMFPHTFHIETIVKLTHGLRNPA